MRFISNSHRAANAVLFILGDSPASEFSVSTFRNTVCSILIGRLNGNKFYEDGTESFETAAQKFQILANHPPEIIQKRILVFFLFCVILGTPPMKMELTVFRNVGI
jgi:CRISPR/Cas system Type II protein with McrA/HNH and RuvC-like nuclease domain